jgi:hypothetical protein
VLKGTHSPGFNYSWGVFVLRMHFQVKVLLCDESSPMLGTAVTRPVNTKHVTRQEYIIVYIHYVTRAFSFLYIILIEGIQTSKHCCGSFAALHSLALFYQNNAHECT